MSGKRVGRRIQSSTFPQSWFHSPRNSPRYTPDKPSPVISTTPLPRSTGYKTYSTLSKTPILQTGHGTVFLPTTGFSNAAVEMSAVRRGYGQSTVYGRIYYIQGQGSGPSDSLSWPAQPGAHDPAWLFCPSAGLCGLKTRYVDVPSSPRGLLSFVHVT